MNLNEVEREGFEKLLYAFVDKHGPEPLKDLFRLQKVLKRITKSSHLPTALIHYSLLFFDLQKEEYHQLSFHDKMQKLKENNGLSERSINEFVKRYYIPRVNSEKKRVTRSNSSA
ncbi:MAG: hypothetical protein FD122_2671 [Stygiobacter sp.]|nr:MAG: hypothetical protein FD122_2671 [Stygiobacter sp.]KAF0215206.1 MAG: hypothetical protein FD178_1845 [Ignavibacteria bacterium]